MQPAWDARAASIRDRLRREIDPEGRLPESVIGPMIDAGVKEHYQRLAYKSALARSRKAAERKARGGGSDAAAS
jgi:hypothetical protein